MIFLHVTPYSYLLHFLIFFPFMLPLYPPVLCLPHIHYNLGMGPLVGQYSSLIAYFNSPDPSSRTMALGSTHPLTEMNTSKRPGGKGRPAHTSDNLIANCEPTVYKMWEPRRLTTL
jgi:hypothetical protein